MIWRTYENDEGEQVMRMDLEAIEYLMRGLEQLRDADPGTMLTTPAFVEGDDGMPEAASATVLERAPDKTEES